MKNIRLWGTVVTAGGTLAAITALSAQPSEASSQLTVNATTATSAFVIPCSSCVLHSAPSGAHTGGAEYDSGSITTSPVERSATTSSRRPA